MVSALMPGGAAEACGLKQGDVVEIVDHYPLYNLGSSHSQQFVVNPDGTIALKSDSSLVLGYDGPHSGLFTQNADGSISPTHAPHLVLGARMPSADEMKRKLLKEMSGLGLAVAWCGRSTEDENACIDHHS